MSRIRKATIWLCYATLAFGMFFPCTQQARAASATLFTDNLSDARPAALANHDIKFKMDAATTIANTEHLDIKFNGFTVGSATLVQADFAVLHDADGAGSYTALTATTDYTVATVTAGADKTAVVTFTAAGATAISTDKYIEVIFTNGANKLPNPSVGSYTIDIDSSNFGDVGSVQIAIVNGVTTTIGVAASLSVAVTAKNTGTINGTDITETNSTATALDFSTGGNMTVNTAKVAAQTVTVSTNAAGGYSTFLKVLTAGASGTNDVLSDGSNNCDGFIDSSATNSAPKLWNSSVHPNGTSANTNTCWYGYNTSDTSLSVVGDGANRFGANKFAPFSTIASEVAYDTAPVNSQATDIGYRVEVNALQPRGVYTGTTEYITTAIF